eukprot:GFYU01054394.1.p1 GENE.GFYU01054394.1~~GFYU01054394.1.p1  ORF type:complete len:104 (+),score=4.31 GFYU01054394.1:481-792(+)
MAHGELERVVLFGVPSGQEQDAGRGWWDPWKGVENTCGSVVSMSVGGYVHPHLCAALSLEASTTVLCVSSGVHPYICNTQSPNLCRVNCGPCHVTAISGGFAS